MEKIVIYAIPLFLVLLLTEAIYSHLKNKHFYRLNDSLGNLGAGIINQIISLFVKSGTLQFYEMFMPTLTSNLWGRGVLSWILGIVLVDLVYYFYHRHSHEINIFWASHIVHHSSEEYNLSVALRQSAFSFVVYSLYSIPLALIGLPVEIFAVANAISLVYQFWIHTRVIKRLGFFETIFNTPSHHRVHHARQGKYLDCNYGGVFIIWDKMFGTFIKEEEEPIYGIYPRFQSYDPVKANLYPLQEMFHYFYQSKKLNSLKVFFSGPLWTYNQFKKGKKLNILNSNREVGLFSIILFLLSIGFTIFILFNQNLSLYSVIVISFLIVGTLKWMGLRLDKNKI